MKRQYLTKAIGFLVLSNAISAIAGPDFDAIAHGRKLRDAQALEGPVSPTSSAGSASTIGQSRDAPQTNPGCQPDERVLPLDHGPQAQTTPSLNRQRVEQRDAALQECKSRMWPSGRPTGSPDAAH